MILIENTSIVLNLCVGAQFSCAKAQYRTFQKKIAKSYEKISLVVNIVPWHTSIVLGHNLENPKEIVKATPLMLSPSLFFFPYFHFTHTFLIFLKAKTSTTTKSQKQNSNPSSLTNTTTAWPPHHLSPQTA